MFLVSIGEREATSIITYNSIIKNLDMQLQIKSRIENKRKIFSLCDITEHRTIK